MLMRLLYLLCEGCLGSLHTGDYCGNDWVTVFNGHKVIYHGLSALFYFRCKYISFFLNFLFTTVNICQHHAIWAIFNYTRYFY